MNGPLRDGYARSAVLALLRGQTEYALECARQAMSHDRALAAGDMPSMFDEESHRLLDG